MPHGDRAGDRPGRREAAPRSPGRKPCEAIPMGHY
jgi:hypothetical protein